MRVKVWSRGSGLIVSTLAVAACGDSLNSQDLAETSEQGSGLPSVASDESAVAGHPKVRPLRPCVHEASATKRYALFGYRNDSSAAVKVPVGSDNRFERGAIGRGQPETFLPGQHPSVFYVELGDEPAVWTLNEVSVRASRESPACEPTRVGRLDSPTAIVHGPRDGQVTIDASGQKSIFPMPKAVRKFSSKHDVIEFAKKELNAIPVKNAQTGEVSVEGAVRALGKSMYIRDGRLEEVQDPIAAYLGGPWGYFMVGDEKICVDEKCEKADPRASGDPCSANGQFCTDDYSFVTHFFFYHSVGSETEQTRGGFDIQHYLCFRFIFPWICSRSSGWNRLQLANSFFGTILPPPEIPRFILGGEVTGNNVEEVTSKLWSLFAPPTGGTVEATISGVCGYHLSNGPQGFTQSQTQAGSASCLQ